MSRVFQVLKVYKAPQVLAAAENVVMIVAVPVLVAVLVPVNHVIVDHLAVDPDPALDPVEHAIVNHLLPMVHVTVNHLVVHPAPILILIVSPIQASFQATAHLAHQDHQDHAPHINALDTH